MREILNIDEEEAVTIGEMYRFKFGKSKTGHYAKVLRIFPSEEKAKGKILLILYYIRTLLSATSFWSKAEYHVVKCLKQCL